MVDKVIDVSALRAARRRRRRMIWISAFGAIIIFLLGGSLWLVFRSPLFRVLRVEVNGNQTLSSDAVLDALKSKIQKDHVFARVIGLSNMLSWPAGNIVLSDLPDIKSAVIRKSYTQKAIMVEVAERTPYGVWCEGDGDARHCRWFDEDGVLFREAPAVEGSLLPEVHDATERNLTTGAVVLPSEFVGPLFSVFSTLQSSKLGIKEITIQDLTAEELTVTTYDGPTLYFSLRFPADSAAPILQSLASSAGLSTLHTIDFRVQNRVYYK